MKQIITYVSNTLCPLIVGFFVTICSMAFFMPQTVVIAAYEHGAESMPAMMQSMPVIMQSLSIKNTDHLPLISNGHGDFYTDYAKIATKVVQKSGNWSAIWGNKEPGPNDIVLIPAGINVVYDIAPEHARTFRALALKGSLSFSTTKNTKMKVGTIMMYSGTFTIKNQNKNITSEIVFTGDTPNDVLQFNLGFVAFGGTVTIEGAQDQLPYLKTTVKKGASALNLNIGDVSQWKEGDELIFSDSQTGVDASHWSYRHDDPKFRKAFPQQWEMRRIKSIGSGSARDGAQNSVTITLNAPLQYDHNGYVAHLSRNVEFRSEAAAVDEGELKITERAHLMFIGTTGVTVKNARIKDMGRTTTDVVDDATVDASGKLTHKGANMRGRYALHMHHLQKPFTVEGVVVTGSEVSRNINGSIEHAIMGSPRWGIVNHYSFGTVRNNIVIGAAGAGIVGEDGTETGAVEGNLVIGTGQGTGGGDDGRFAMMKGTDLAYGGFGYWFHGPFLEVNNNIATGYFKQAGFGYFLHPEFSKSRLPDIVGMPPEYKGKDINVNSQGIRSFKGNIADGIFGDSAFSIFYTSVPHEINNFSAINRNKNGLGMDVRYTRALTVRDSHIQGTSNALNIGTGIGIHSNKETKEINLVRTPVSGFAKVTGKD
jgi:hypothetical protein